MCVEAWMIWFLQSSVSDRKSFANVLGTLQFIEHGGGIVLRRDFAFALFVLNKLVFAQPVAPLSAFTTWSRGSRAVIFSGWRTIAVT